MKNLWLLVWTARYSTGLVKQGNLVIHMTYTTRKKAQAALLKQFSGPGDPYAQVVRLPQNVAEEAGIPKPYTVSPLTRNNISDPRRIP